MTVAHPSQSVTVLLTVWLALAASGLEAQEPLAHAKELYASAAYDEALAALDLLQSSGSPDDATEIGEYRVFCLLALDRNEDARRAIETLVTANPLYRPSEAQASPRVRAVFQDVRRRLLPQIVQRSYADAKAAFDRRDLRDAAVAFDGVIALLDDDDAKAMPGLADFRTLAIGFRDFSKAAAPAAVANSPGPAPAPTTSPITPVPAAPAPHAAPIYAAGDPTVIPPVVVSQKMPLWQSPPRGYPEQEYRGVLELVIDENGSVESAIMSAAIFPSYDPVLLKAARGWKFRPATKNGAPVKYRKQLEIRLRPAGVSE